MDLAETLPVHKQFDARATQILSELASKKQRIEGAKKLAKPETMEQANDVMHGLYEQISQSVFAAHALRGDVLKDASELEEKRVVGQFGLTHYRKAGNLLHYCKVDELRPVLPWLEPDFLRPALG